MNRVFVDLDGVVSDFDSFKTARGLTTDEVKKLPGAYREMPPIPGALEAVRRVIGMGFEVWIATKPPTGIPYAYSDKAAWVFEHLPELKRHIIITHDKGLLGSEGDFLCDDRPHKANCQNFAGTLLAFVDGYHWPQALAHLENHRPAREAVTGDTAPHAHPLAPTAWPTNPLEQCNVLLAKRGAGVRTPSEAQDIFSLLGVSVAAWAREYGLSYPAVSRLLRNGANSTMRGETHKIAVLLGLKDGSIVETDDRRRSFMISILGSARVRSSFMNGEPFGPPP